MKDHPDGWLVVFEAKDRKRYAATQTYFVTTDGWQGIMDQIARQIKVHLRQTGRPGGRVRNETKGSTDRG